MHKRTGVLALSAIAIFAFLATSSARADDYAWSGDFALGDPAITETHADTEPFAGWVNVTMTNTGTEPWGDFHFEIFSVGADVSNVDFLVDLSHEPTSSQSSLSWVVDNVSVGAKIDLFYYLDPVMPGETANFSVYTNNPDHLSFFGVMFYPTPLPEPATLALLGFGLLALRRRSR